MTFEDVYLVQQCWLRFAFAVVFFIRFFDHRPGVIVSFREVWYTSGQASQWKTRLSFSITYATTLLFNLWEISETPRSMESLCLWLPDAFRNCWPLEIPVASRSHALLTNLDFSWKESDTMGNSWQNTEIRIRDTKNNTVCEAVFRFSWFSHA